MNLITGAVMRAFWFLILFFLHMVPGYALSQEQALSMLKAGNRRFFSGRQIHPHSNSVRLGQAARDSQNRHVFAVVVSCADSHVPVELLFDAGFLDLVVLRGPGLKVSQEQIETVDHAIKLSGAPVLVVLGHKHCEFHRDRNAVQPELQVKNAIQKLFRFGDALSSVKIVGAVFDEKSGEVNWLPEQSPIAISKQLSRMPSVLKKAETREKYAPELEAEAAPQDDYEIENSDQSKIKITLSDTLPVENKVLREKHQLDSRQRIEVKNGNTLWYFIFILVFFLILLWALLQSKWISTVSFSRKLYFSLGLLIVMACVASVSNHRSLVKVSDEMHSSELALRCMSDATTLESLLFNTGTKQENASGKKVDTLLDSMKVRFLEIHAQSNEEEAILEKASGFFNLYEKHFKSFTEQVTDYQNKKSVLDTLINELSILSEKHLLKNNLPVKFKVFLLSIKEALWRLYLEKDFENLIPVLEKSLGEAYSALEIYQRKSADSFSALQNGADLKRKLDELQSNLKELLRDLVQLEQKKQEAFEDMELFKSAIKNLSYSLDRRAGMARNNADNISMVLIAGMIVLGVILSTAIIKITAFPLKILSDELDSSSQYVGTGSKEVSNASQSLAQGATDQAASIEETSSSLEEIAAAGQNNLQRTEHAANVMKETREQMQKGSGAVYSMSQAMEEIDSYSERISGIIKIIEEIAFQTNLLALNAAVEAARAGDAGQGFAVVADEVRNLAQRCSSAAHDTTELIEGTIEKVKNGSKHSVEMKESFEAIETSSSRLDLIINEMHTSIAEQASGLKQVRQAVCDMEKVTQGSAASSEQGAAAAEELSSQAEELKYVVLKLRAIVEGTRKS
jgi:methyl-accepting chemotaxis protein